MKSNRLLINETQHQNLQSTKSHLSNQLDEDIVTAAVNEIIHLEDKSPNQRLPHKKMKETMEELASRGITLTCNQLNYRKRLARVVGSVVVEMIPVAEVLIVAADESSFTTSLDSIGLSTKDERAKRGRPIGTTTQAKHDRDKNRINCINDIVRLYQEEKSMKSNEGKRTSKGFLNNLISDKWQEYDLYDYGDTQSEVSPCTIRSRLNKCINPYASHRGLQPPIEEVEDLIVDIAVQVGKICKPLSVGETMSLANFLISGSLHQLKLIEWKKRIYPDLP
jgi:uncharacterized membrane protein YheB (UPF0754 family)